MNILISISVIVAWVVINALIINWLGVIYYHITGIITVIGIVCLFILSQPYWAYSFGIVVIFGASNVMTNDILKETGEINNRETWT